MRKDMPRIASAVCLCAAGVAWTTMTQAQPAAPTPSVEEALLEEGASAGVVNAGIAIQDLCVAMKKAGYKAPVSGAATGPAGASQAAGNLFLRCNEIVQTANVLTKADLPTPRSLGFGGLASTVQQINGEETNAQSALALRVPSGQFSNIGARINALRYGGLAAFDRLGAANGNSDSDAPMLANVQALHRQYQAWNDLAEYDSSADWRALPVAYYGNDGGVAASGGSQSGAAQSYRPEHDSPFGIFTEGGYGWGHRDETTNEDAFRYHSYSVTVGADYRFANAAVGASVGFDRYSASFDTIGAGPGQSPAPPAVDGGDARVDGYSGSLFALWYFGNFSVNGILTYGHLQTDVTRIVDYTGTTTTCTNCGPGSAVALRGDPGGQFAAGAVTAQYDLSFAGFDVSPSVSANYRRAVINSYTEQDPSSSGLALQYGEQNIESFRSIVGINFARVFSPSFGVLTPNFKAEWHHEFRDEPNSVVMRYATVISGVTGNFSFVSPTDKPESDFGIVGVGVTALFANRLQSYAYYERLVGVPYLKDNALSVGLRAQF